MHNFLVQQTLHSNRHIRKNFLHMREAWVNVRSNATLRIVGYVLSVKSELKTLMTLINVVFRHDLTSSAWSRWLKDVTINVNKCKKNCSLYTC